jgi:hypothetical protein
MAVRMIAKKRFWYGGIRLQPNDTFGATETHAKLFRVMGNAVDAKAEKPKAPKVTKATKVTKEAGEKGSYQRRDMRASA